MNNHKIQPVCNINLNAYLGKWFQFSTNLVTSLFGPGPFSYCITAEYGLEKDGKTLSVKNRALNLDLKNINGIDGICYSQNNNCDGLRKVKFPGIPIDGEYIIAKLGPIINNQYNYAIVLGPLPFIGRNIFGDINPNTTALYVLCRDPQEFKNNYFCEVSDWLISKGFNNILNRQILSVNSVCKPCAC